MTAPTIATRRIRDWITVYTRGAATPPRDLLASSFATAPLYLSDIQTVLDAFDKPCGSCHPCANYADETWRAAGRKPPHVYQWDGAQAVLAAIREALDNADDAEDALTQVAQIRKALAGDLS